MSAFDEESQFMAPFLYSPLLPSLPMFATAALLASLDTITHETTSMLTVLDDAEMTTDRREAKRRVLELRGLAQELFDWLAVAGLEEPRN